MNRFGSLVEELELAIQQGSPARRAEMLRQVTDLFLGGAASFSDKHIEIFDDVLIRLTKQVENHVLAEIGAKLAPVNHAPYGLLRSFAQHDEIDIAGPVLTLSKQLTDGDLIEIAQTKGQAHLGAISERERLASALTDILVERGDSTVVRKLAQNRGASFSNTGFARMTERAELDDTLAANLAGRVDMPLQMLHQLVAKATETVRARLLALVPEESQQQLQDLLASASVQALWEATAPRDYRQAEAVVGKLHDDNQLNEAALVSFATSHQYEEMVVALARLCSAPIDLIEQFMKDPRYSGLLVACKAAGLHWPALRAILSNRFSDFRVSSTELEQARADFLKVSAATAQRMFRFWLVRGQIGVAPGVKFN